MDYQQEIEHLLDYKMNPKHKVVEHIDYIYSWLFRLYMHCVHEFYIKQKMKIVFDLVQQSFKDRLSSLDFNTIADEMLLKREPLYTVLGIQCINRRARHLYLDAKFILWFDTYELGGHDDIDDIVEDPDYVPTK